MSRSQLDSDSLIAAPLPDQDQARQPYGDRAHLLAEVDTSDALEGTPTAVCCPNCGQPVTFYNEGLSEVVRFDEHCERCGVDLRPWCSIAVDAAYVDTVEPSALTEMTQSFWDEWLWGGITTNKAAPRTREWSDRLTEKATEFGWDWDVSCPLCRRSLTELKRASAVENGHLDYHHWSKVPDIGICLCRECHDAIGFNVADITLEKQAEDWGFESRVDLQIVRFALRDAVATGHQVGPWSAQRLVDRYNIDASVERVQALLRLVAQDEDLRERFIDETLADGLSR